MSRQIDQNWIEPGNIQVGEVGFYRGVRLFPCIIYVPASHSVMEYALILCI